MRDLASGVRDQGLDPFADNGNFELVGKTESHLWDRARGVFQKVRTAEDALGYRARRGDLPAPLRKLGAGIGSKSSPANQSAGAAQRSGASNLDSQRLVPEGRAARVT